MIRITLVLSAGAGYVAERISYVFCVGLVKERIDFSERIEVIGIVDKFGINALILHCFVDNVARDDFTHISEMNRS